MTGLSASKVPASSEYALGSSQAHSLKEVPLHSANASPLHLGHSPSGIGTAVKPEQYPSAFPPSRYSGFGSVVHAEDNPAVATPALASAAAAIETTARRAPARRVFCHRGLVGIVRRKRHHQSGTSRALIGAVSYHGSALERENE
jgi:hypothetical protein